MKRVLMTSAAALIAAAPAFAGNGQAPIVTTAPAAVPAPVFVSTGSDWTGFYAGGSLGYATASESDDTVFDDDGYTYGIHQVMTMTSGRSSWVASWNCKVLTLQTVAIQSTVLPVRKCVQGMTLAPICLT